MNNTDPSGFDAIRGAANSSDTHDFLTSGHRYRVIRAFVDYDRMEHPVGETWIFVGSSFLPYEDGLTLYVSPDGTSELQIRMQWRPDEQGPVLDALADYIAEA